MNTLLTLDYCVVFTQYVWYVISLTTDISSADRTVIKAWSVKRPVAAFEEDCWTVDSGISNA